MKMEVVSVELDNSSYPVYIGTGLLDDQDLLRRHVRGNQVMLVSNEIVGPIYADKIASAFADRQLDSIYLPDGEIHKTLQTFETVISALLANKHDRSTTILALGGGVTGDIAGFVAACYRRGVDFIQIPTTLLAQVDASVGGKTAVNHALGKNMIGAFYQPNCVLIDVNCLQTLPAREFKAGLAEIIKHGAIRDLRLFEWLEDNLSSILDLDQQALVHLIKRNCEIKASVVSEDETEQGIRAVLNFGHTFGHAIETSMGYGNWLHGEAVAAGMVMAADLSMRLGLLESKSAGRLKSLVARAGLPVVPPAELRPDEIFELMRLDKKVQNGRIRFVVLKGLGDAIVEDEIEPEMVLKTLGAGELLCQPS